MPDWSYQTIFKPILQQMPASAAEHVTSRAAAALNSMPGGSYLVQFFGNMQPPPQLRINEVLLAGKLQTKSVDTNPFSLSIILRSAWVAFAIVGIGLVVTGVSAMTVGLTSVIRHIALRMDGLEVCVLRWLTLAFLRRDSVFLARSAT